MLRVSRSSSSSASPATYPVYTTYTEEELQQAFAKLSHIGTNGKAVGNQSRITKNGSGSKLIKSHECAVFFHDGTSGLCKYTRGGPTWHVFHFEASVKQADEKDKGTVPCHSATRPASLPSRHCLEPMANTVAAIEAKAVELAPVAFAAAIALEHKDRFKRAVAPTGYNRYNTDRAANSTAQPQMSVHRAKELSGKYALCLKLGSDDSQRFLPCLSFVFDTIEEANEAWLQHENRARRFVACLCRYSRQWELPVYNPLHAELEYATLLGIAREIISAEVVD